MPWTPALVTRGFAVVPAIQRWCADPAIVPCHTLISHLVSFAPVRISSWDRVAFILDGDRTGPKRADPRAFDNRYLQNPDLLPSPDLLRGLGFTHSVWISRGGLAHDLAPYVESLSRAGMSSEAVSIARAGH
ncbi:MAG: hypothetical protein HY534_05005 [Chloroflexi bacterium]|nr:hypothetical protein [Chloroflexota bacterium]